MRNASDKRESVKTTHTFVFMISTPVSWKEKLVTNIWRITLLSLTENFIPIQDCTDGR